MGRHIPEWGDYVVGTGVSQAAARGKGGLGQRDSTSGGRAAMREDERSQEQSQAQAFRLSSSTSSIASISEQMQRQNELDSQRNQLDLQRDEVNELKDLVRTSLVVCTCKHVSDSVCKRVSDLLCVMCTRRFSCIEARTWRKRPKRMKRS